ncbi:MAG: FAD-dependent monooxygenase [Crocinitomicaceae bacterium]|nr:FAD-dependent monooxygenase [Crocinitomicaceae bacterium]
MANDKSKYDVIIIGGGPAGIATSLTLTARGFSNCIVEARYEPINKPGEAIPPNAKPLLEKLGLTYIVNDSKHSQYYGNKSCWGTNKLEQKEFIRDVYGPGFLLDRLYFESQLRRHVRKYGGSLLIGYKLKEIISKDRVITVSVDNGENVKTLHGSYIVDATGRKASVANQFGGNKRKLDEQFALTFKVKLECSIQRQITVEATENGWWYAAPQGESELIVMFFTIKKIVPKKEQIPMFLKKELESSFHISLLLDIALMDFNQIKMMPAGTSRLDIPYGDNWLAVGDAAYSYDPISSYGITSSLASGFYGGHAIASALNNKKDAMDSYLYLMETTFHQYMEKKIAYYSEERRWIDSPYWKSVV